MTRQSTMRAAVLDAHSAPFRARDDLHARRPAPRRSWCGSRASGVNPLDTKIHAGAAAHARHPLPAILGIDLAGVVEADRARASRASSRGDEVYGMTGGVGGRAGIARRISPPSMPTCSR